MPFPFALAGAMGGFGGITRALGISEQRLRTPAQNRAARVRQISEAVVMAREGKRLGVMLLLQWSGQLPNLTVQDPSYRGGTPQGRMPSDGVEGALRALETLRTEGTLVGTKLRPGLKADADIEGARQGVRSAAKERSFAEAFAADIDTATGKPKPKRRAGAARAASGDEDADTSGSGRKVTRYAPPDWRKRRVFENSVAGDTWPDRLATRYDPETGRKRRVPEIDPFDQWPSTKAEWRRGGGAVEQLLGGRQTGAKGSAMRSAISRKVAAAGLTATATLVGKFSAMAAAAGMAPAAAAALVVSAGLISYGITTVVLNAIRNARDPAMKKQKIAMEYRKARGKLAAEKGRALNATEQKVLAEWFKDRMRTAGFGSTLGAGG